MARGMHGEGGMCGEGGACIASGGWAWQESQPLQRTVCIVLECILVTTCKRSCGKVMFLQLSVILFMGGLSQCMLGYHPPPRASNPLEQEHPPPRSSPCAVHAGRYGQQAGGMHPTGMQSCFLTDIRAYGEEIYCFSCSILLHLHITDL